VSTGWIQAGFFAVLALVVFAVFHRIMGRSSVAFAAFAWTLLTVPAISLIQEFRPLARDPRPGPPRCEPAPADATYEAAFSFGPLAWPSALVLWVLLPLTAVAAGVDLAAGLLTHNVAGSMGSLIAVVVGMLAGLGVWIALRTLSLLRLGADIETRPLWTEAPKASLSFRALRAGWPRRTVCYYRRTDRPPWI
jgi:hypothetical protein